MTYPYTPLQPGSSIVSPDIREMVSLPCTGQTELMYDVAREAEAVAVCLTCHYREACLELAIQTGEQWGVWGATTRKTRLPKIRAYRKDHPVEPPHGTPLKFRRDKCRCDICLPAFRAYNRGEKAAYKARHSRTS